MDDALYHCFITATTVGYGDMSIVNEEGRQWATLHIAISVSLLGAIIGKVDSLRSERELELKKWRQLQRKLDPELIEARAKYFLVAERYPPPPPGGACATTRTINPGRSPAWHQALDRDGSGVDKLEFVLGMLTELDFCSWDDIDPFLRQFDELDADGSGTLTKSDLVKMQSSPNLGKPAKTPML